MLAKEGHTNGAWERIQVREGEEGERKHT